MLAVLPLQGLLFFALFTEQFDAFIRRHRARNPVPESNEDMKDSYLILDEQMRFLNCQDSLPHADTAKCRCQSRESFRVDMLATVHVDLSGSESSHGRPHSHSMSRLFRQIGDL